MLEPYSSRQDMDVDDIERKMKELKRDRRMSKDHKWQELRRLTALLRWFNGDWTVRPAHDDDASVDEADAVVYNDHHKFDGQQGAVNAYHADSQWYLRRRPRLHR